MRQEGTFTVRAAQGDVWEFFLDPFKLGDCLDDPHTIEVIDEDTFRGQVKSGIGFVRGTFNASAKVVEKEPPSMARIKARGSGMGSAFDVDSRIELSENEGVTTVHWTADVILRGTIATVGARLAQGTIDQKTNAFFEKARSRLEGFTPPREGKSYGPL